MEVIQFGRFGTLSQSMNGHLGMRTCPDPCVAVFPLALVRESWWAQMGNGEVFEGTASCLSPRGMITPELDTGGGTEKN